MKRFLSVLLSVMFTIFGICTPNFSYATSINSSNVVSDAKELTAKEKQSSKGSSKISDEQFNGIRNVVGHPFSIIIRAAGWGILAALLSNFLPVSEEIATAIGVVCGATSKALALYVEGFENGFKE